MCWCLPFCLPNHKKRKTATPGEKRTPERPAPDLLQGNGIPVIAQAQEKRESKDASRARRSRETATTRSPRSEREGSRLQQRQQLLNAHRGSVRYGADLKLQVPNIWHRPIALGKENSSQEMLLSPTPHTTAHHRQRHLKRSSQTTLRGRGAKRDPL